MTFANVESSTIGLRLQARMEEKARSGIPLTPQRIFGYSKDWTQIIEPEAVLIREAARRFLDGETIHAIVRDWNAREISPTSGVWTVVKLSKLLRSPRLAGDNTFHDMVVSRGLSRRSSIPW